MIEYKPKWNFEDLERIDSESGVRYYKIPDSNQSYPSVTTVLSSLSKPYIDDWVARVGEEEANRRKNNAALRGTKVHDLLERYLKGDKINWSKENPLTINYTHNIRNYLDQNLTEVWALESKVYSHRLQVAGTTDCVGVLNDLPTLIDFKTSTREKKKEDITSYFLQASAYCVCIKEMTGFWIPDICIILTYENDACPGIYKEKAKNYIKDFYNLRKQFNEFIV